MKKRTLLIIVTGIVIVAAGCGWIWLRFETSGFSALQAPSANREM